jgi:glutaredoxin 3
MDATNLRPVTRAIVFPPPVKGRQSKVWNSSCRPTKPLHLAAMNVIVYRKTGCPWAAAVMGFLSELAIPFEMRTISDDQYLREVEAKSGQSKSPTLDIDGHILPDASVEDVAEYLEKLGRKI